MTQSSFPFLLSSSSSQHRLITLISILLLNPLPIIYGAPTPDSKKDLTVQRQKRQLFSTGLDEINFEKNEEPSEPVAEIVFEGLIGKNVS